MAKALPAPSLRELARPKGVTEGVSFVGCFGPMVYPPAIINSEIFERLRSSGDTPSVSFADSSLREGAGTTSPHNVNHPPAGCFVSGRVIFGLCVGVHFTIQPGACETVGLRAIFIAPTKTLKLLSGYEHRTTLPQSRIRSTAPSEREPGCGLYHSTGYLRNRGVAGDFHRPYETQKILHFTIHCTAQKPQGWGRFLSFMVRCWRARW